MQRKQLIPLVLLVLTVYPTSAFPINTQVSSVILFYEVLSSDSATVDQFFNLFGTNNEAEVEIALRQEFPSLDLKGAWFEDPVAKEFIDGILKQPGHAASRFIKCIKESEPSLFNMKKTRMLEFPPSREGDFMKYRVRDDHNEVVFEFSQEEITIENIYLPSGESIFKLVEGCAK